MNSSGNAVLAPGSSAVLRRTLQMLLRDSDRRQDLIQELIVTNNQLRYSGSSLSNNLCTSTYLMNCLLPCISHFNDPCKKFTAYEIN